MTRRACRYWRTSVQRRHGCMACPLVPYEVHTFVVSEHAGGLPGASQFIGSRTPLQVPA